MIFKDIFFNIVFPFPSLCKATKAINRKIKKLSQSTQEETYNYEYASNKININDKVLLETLKDTIENKKILEDKAKSSLIAITISSTLIINIMKFVQEIKDNSFFKTIILAIVGFLSLLYMIIAGVLSLYSIGEINTVATMYPEDYLLPEQEKKTQIADNIEHNYLNNLKRNNFMTTSYKCMITSITLLIVVFIISTIIVWKDYDKKDEVQQFKKEVEIINSNIEEVQKLATEVESNSDEISILSNEVSADKQNIIDIQNKIMDIINDKENLTEKYNNIVISVEKINQIVANNPKVVTSEIQKLLLDLEEKMKTDVQ